MLMKTESKNYENIADAIRDKKNTADKYLPSEMAEAVRSISDTITIHATVTARDAQSFPSAFVVEESPEIIYNAFKGGKVIRMALYDDDNGETYYGDLCSAAEVGDELYMLGFLCGYIENYNVYCSFDISPDAIDIISTHIYCKLPKKSVQYKNKAVFVDQYGGYKVDDGSYEVTLNCNAESIEDVTQATCSLTAQEFVTLRGEKRPYHYKVVLQNNTYKMCNPIVTDVFDRVIFKADNKKIITLEIRQGAGTSNVFSIVPYVFTPDIVVTFQDVDGVITPDKTPEEIIAADANGKAIRCVYKQYRLPLSYVGNGFIAFGGLTLNTEVGLADRIILFYSPGSESWTLSNG